MTACLKLKKSNCKNCHKCIRHCPVKSIKFSDNQANIIDDECILCGQCFVNCPQGAKEIRNDVAQAKALLESGAPVYASIAPSFVANYDNASIASMKTALMQLGFAGAEETAIGATIVKQEYDRMVNAQKQDIILSSCCHSVNLLIQKHFDELLPFLAHVDSPMQAHCKDLKRRFPGCKTVFIGPCISKKDEAERYPGIVDCALTFEELSAWLKEQHIALAYVEDNNNESKARLFPTAGGILRTMEKQNKNYAYLTIDGVDNCIHALKDILNGTLHHCFIEMSACVGSCIGGPAMDKNHRAPVRDFIAVNGYAGDQDFPVSMPAGQNLAKEMHSLATIPMQFGSRAIEEVLHKMGKTKPEDELNCGSCGYNTCRDKAVAVLQGKAEITMCLPYLKEKAESFSDMIVKNSPNALIVLNELFEVQQINGAACKLLNIRDPKNVLGDQVVRILDPVVFMQAQEGKNTYNKPVYLAEYQKYVEQTVIYDRSYHSIVCIMRAITSEQEHQADKEEIRRTTIEVTDKVIQKQMRAVQEIASLLGETTAETKVALTKLKESLEP